MKSSRWLGLAILCAAPACNLYNDVLIEEATGDSGQNGGSPSGGGQNTGGGSGGEDTGGTNSGGGTSGSGGTGGEDTGGTAGDGGTTAGGGSGGDTGGAPSGGGGGGDGGSGGTAGSGGSGGGEPMIGLIDDFIDAGASYTNLPFYGSWSRYIQPAPGVWTETSVGAMMQPNPEDAADGAFHVQATMLDDWGVGTFVTLKGSGLPVNLTGVTGVKFWVICMNDETTLRVALADVNSHSPACEDVNAGADCDKHIRTAAPPVLTNSWQEVTLPFDTFIDKAVATTARVADLDLTQVFAIHIQMQTEQAGQEADFYIDDLETY